jgi:hypothetical protein
MDAATLVIAAGGIVFADRWLNRGKPDLVVAVSTGAAALATAGIDVLAPGMGRGLGMLLVVGALLTSGPALVSALTVKK